MNAVEFSPARLGAGMLVLGVTWIAAGMVADVRFVYAGAGFASLGVLLMAAFESTTQGDEVAA